VVVAVVPLSFAELGVPLDPEPPVEVELVPVVDVESLGEADWVDPAVADETVADELDEDELDEDELDEDELDEDELDEDELGVVEAADSLTVN
jgi:hypothetical protein